MKYVIRRFVFGIVLAPIVALAYTALYAYLVLIGGNPNSSLVEVLTTGLVIGLGIALLVQFPKLIKKIF